MAGQLDKLNSNLEKVNKKTKIHHDDLKTVGIMGYAQKRRKEKPKTVKFEIQ